MLRAAIVRSTPEPLHAFRGGRISCMKKCRQMAPTPLHPAKTHLFFSFSQQPCFFRGAGVFNLFKFLDFIRYFHRTVQSIKLPKILPLILNIAQDVACALFLFFLKNFICIVHKRLEFAKIRCDSLIRGKWRSWGWIERIQSKMVYTWNIVSLSWYAVQV